MQYHLSPKPHGLTCFVIVGGLGDRGENYTNLVKNLCNRFTELCFCTFTLTQEAINYDELLSTQTHELEEVLSHLINHERISNFILYTSSMGAFATTQMAVHPVYSKHISQIMYFDPANYYLQNNSTRPSRSITWAGYENYQPDKATVSELLKNINSLVKISVVHFTIRNHGPNGYCKDKLVERGADDPKCFTRLNTDMVKSFFSNTPEKNRDRYIEINNLPHGYFRDGNLNKNLEVLTVAISSLLK